MDMMLVGTHIARWGRRQPGKTALIDGERRLNWGELDRRSDRVTAALQARGIRRGDKIGFIAEACLEWVIAYLGIVKLGAVAVPLNYRLTPAELADSYGDAECRLLFTTREFNGAVQAESVSLEELAAFETDRIDDAPPAEVHAEDPNVILFTGGTTGRSKGVVLTHANLFWNSVNMVTDTHMRQDDNTILATPLHHSAALNCWLLPHLYLGATATILRKYSAEAMLRAIAGARATNGFTPPSMARELFLHPLARELDIACFKRWYIGGGILPRQDREKIHALLPDARIYYQYGITEAGPIATVLREEDYEAAPDSIGRAFTNIEACILREDLSPADADEVGELCLRGPSVTPGYYKRPEANKAAFHRGWLRTGDMARMDAAGFIYFHDRLKDMIKTGGLNVFSQEVEYVLARHPAVREVAVLGLPSEKWGEEVTAIVALRDGAAASPEELAAHARATLAGFKVPKSFRFIPYAEMPINYSGKILKRELRARLIPK
ncbi:class I adenylate-forming enzyme family protein [Desertibaculum subflavum]|uniref:class I adenylate-forming enzyme family protein n=1 Tax=Desertibaculum subflavum TaxID=2268458 RepID=UPI0034D1A280